MTRGLPSAAVALAVLLVLGGCFGAGPSPTGPPGWSASASATASASQTQPAASPTPAALPTAVPTMVPTAPPTASPTAAPTATPTAAPAPTPAYVTHTVAAGETLGTIASRYATTWQSVVYWNRATYPSLDPEEPAYDPNLIRVGWLLRLMPGTVVPFDAPLPTPAPTPLPTAAPTPTAGASTLVGSGSRGTDRVALTFDMGGRVDPALTIMGWLRDHGVPATVFMTGAMADSTATDAGRQVLAMIDARPDLFDLGNHSYAHPDMTTLSAQAIVDDIAAAEAAIGRHAAQSPRPFFRPPYGAWNGPVLSAVGAAGYGYTVLWDIDTLDWKPVADGGPTAQAIVDTVLGRAQGGSIVLMHLGGYETLDALPDIVAGLRARGYQLVTLGTLLGS